MVFDIDLTDEAFTVIGRFDLDDGVGFDVFVILRSINLKYFLVFSTFVKDKFIIIKCRIS